MAKVRTVPQLIFEPDRIDQRLVAGVNNQSRFSPKRGRFDKPTVSRERTADPEIRRNIG
jgi:hypothetical protein